MTEWRLVDSGDCGAALNMALDEAIATSVQRGDSPPTLRVYGWDSPSVTIGVFQRADDIDHEYCVEHGIPVVRRPTGGRAILHAVEITYSLSAPYTAHPGFGSLRSSYSTIAGVFLEAFRHVGMEVFMKDRRERGRVLSGTPHCFESVSYGEIVAGGHKIMGSAQKRSAWGFLQQGSIPFSVPADIYEMIFGNGPPAAQISSLCPDVSREKLKAAIIHAFEKILEKELIEDVPADHEMERALILAERKYRSERWTFRR